MNKNIRLSVTVITLDEEKNIAKCLKSVEGIVDEIIVVDSKSSDDTVKIARKFGAKVYFRDFTNYADQKNFAVSKARGKWILSMDADEIVEKKLANEIVKVIQLDEFVAYTIPRKNVILGKFIKYSRWQPELDRHVWLWKKGFGKWEGDVHEEVVVDGSVGKLKNAKVHEHYNTLNEFVGMLNDYSEIEAKEMVKKRSKFSLINLIFYPIYNFNVRYFYRLGFLDGMHGFILSSLMGFYHFLVWAKVWEYKNDNR